MIYGFYFCEIIFIFLSSMSSFQSAGACFFLSLFLFNALDVFDIENNRVRAFSNNSEKNSARAVFLFKWILWDFFIMVGDGESLAN